MTDTPDSARAFSTPSQTADAARVAFRGDLLNRFRAQTAGQDVWVFGYASLLT